MHTSLRHKGFRSLWILQRYSCCKLLWESLSQRSQMKKTKEKKAKRYWKILHLLLFVFFFLLTFKPCMYPHHPCHHISYGLFSSGLPACVACSGGSLSNWMYGHDALALQRDRDEMNLPDPGLKLHLWAESQRCPSPALDWPARISSAETPSIFTRTNWNSDRRWNTLFLLSLPAVDVCVYMHLFLNFIDYTTVLESVHGQRACAH